jgi:hypothetical protein
MIACTKLFVIDDVRLVIFKGALNFINLPCWLRSDLSASVVRNCFRFLGYRALPLVRSLRARRCGPVNATIRLVTITASGPPTLLKA